MKIALKSKFFEKNLNFIIKKNKIYKKSAALKKNFTKKIYKKLGET